MSQKELVRWAMNNRRLAESGLPNLEKQGCAIGYPEGPKGVKGEEGRTGAVGLRVRMAGGLRGGSYSLPPTRFCRFF